MRALKSLAAWLRHLQTPVDNPNPPPDDAAMGYDRDDILALIRARHEAEKQARKRRRR